MAMNEEQKREHLLKNAAFLCLKEKFNYDVPDEYNYYRVRPKYMMAEMARIADAVIAAKPRSTFAKKFIPSVIEQFNTKGYVSNKQLSYVAEFIEEFGNSAEIHEKIAAEQKATLAKFEQYYAKEIAEYFPRAEYEYEQYCKQCKAQAAWGYRHGYRY